MISRIGKYRILGELGRGGMGRVYRGYDPDVNRDVAIKVLEAEADSDLLRRFRAEIDTTGSLQHNNIVTLFECGEDSGVPYLVMEVIPGQTLETIIKEKVPLLLLDKVRIMNEVAQGLSFAHSRGVIHRDVKPGNIMRLPDGSVKIMDFGIARVATRKTVMTQEGFIFGTVPYMAPEQFEPGGKADEQTDIFSYADVYYELLTGKQPFAVTNELYPTIQRIKTFEPEGVSRFVPGCPESLELLVHRAMAKDREIRYETFAELLLDNQAVLLDLERERAAEILKEVRPAVEMGDLQRADVLLAQALKLDPGSREARELRQMLRARTDEQRFAGRIAELLVTCENHMAAREFAQAVETLETALRIRKNDTKVRERLAEATGRLNAQLAANKIVAEVRKHFQKAALPEALERLQEALRIDPHHTDALQLKPRIETELARRQDEEIQQRIERSRLLLAQKNFVEALSALTLTDEEPVHPEIAKLRSQILQKKIEHDEQVRVQRFQVGVASVRETLRSGDAAKASEQLDFLEEHFRNIAGAAGSLAELRTELKELKRALAVQAAREGGFELLGAGDFARALQSINAALESFPGEPSLIELRRELEERIEDERKAVAIAAALKHVRSVQNRGRLPEASQAVAEYRRTLGNDAALVSLAAEIQAAIELERHETGLRELLASTRELIGQKRYVEAVAALRASPEYATEAEVRALRDTANESLEGVLSGANRAEQNADFERAIGILTEALATNPAYTAFVQTLERVRSRQQEEQREQRKHELRGSIEKTVALRDWTQAQAGIEQARSEFPDDSAFEELARKVERAIYDLGLEHAAGQVRDQLAANRLSDVADAMNRTGSLYAADPRWKLLEQEVEGRRQYEAALAGSAALLARRELHEAAARLQKLVDQGAPDDRASRMLAEVRAAVRSEADEAIARTVTAVREKLQTDAVDAARSMLAQARQGYPGEAAWPVLDAEIEARAKFLAALQKADSECRRGDYQAADRILGGLDSRSPGDDARIGALAQSVADARRRKAREEAVAEAKKKLRALKKARDLESLLAFLDTSRVEFPEEAAFSEEYRSVDAEIQKRRRDEETRLREAAARNEAAELEKRRKAEDARQREEAAAAELRKAAAAEARAREARANEPAHGGAAPPLSDPTIPSRNGTKRWIGAAAVVVVTIGGAIFWLRPPTPAPTPASTERIPSLAPVRVSSQPAGATVTLGNESCTAPCTLQIPAGSHRLRARMDGYEPAEQTIAIDASNIQRGADIRLELRSLPEPPANVAGKLEVAVNQDDASILVDGRRYGLASMRKPLVASIEAGEHRIRVEKADHAPIDRTIRVVAGETNRITVDLKPLLGKLTITGALPDVQVIVDGANRGRTSGSGTFTLDLPPGRHALRLTRDTYTPREQVVEIVANGTVSLDQRQVELTRIAPDPATVARTEYARVPNEPDRLQEFAERFAGTPEAADARKRAEALRELARRDQANREAAAREQAAREQAEKAQSAAREREARDRKGVMDALSRYENAYAARDVDALRAVWTNVPGGTLEGIRKAFRAYRSITVNLQPTGDPVIKADTARITCRRTVTNVGGPNNPPDLITFLLQRSGNVWVIAGIE